MSRPPGCVVCHFVVPPPTTRCPHCGADNRPWRTWQEAGPWFHARRFFLQSPWGWLALAALLLPLTNWGLFALEPTFFPKLILLLSFLAGAVGLASLFYERDRLWLAELIHQTTPPSERGWLPLKERLLAIGGVGSLFFVLVGGALWLALSAAGQDGGLALTGATRWGIMLLVGLVYTVQILAAGCYSLYAYGQWRRRTFPAPIFLDEDRLRQFAFEEARLRLEMKLRKQPPSVLTLVSAIRIVEAGLCLNLRAELPTDEAYAGHYLIAVQHWQAITTAWGHIRQLDRIGPLEYIPDLSRPHIPPSEPGQLLEGELILSDESPAPSIEDRILRALTASTEPDPSDDEGPFYRSPTDNST